MAAGARMTFRILYNGAVANTGGLVLAGFAFVARADHHAVKVMKDDKAGSYLADAKGMTLYTFKKDSAGKSACAGECVTRWPIYFR